MATDRARNSYDAVREYRTVIAQQGRVTLEADVNEAEAIRTAESRAELRALVGPIGSPDQGFRISIPSTGTPQRFDFAIGTGELYVGGNRVTNGPRATTFSAQSASEWVEYPDDATLRLNTYDGHVPTASRGPVTPYYQTATERFTEAVYLTVCEQEVSAVEDPALREIALGGPDTAARSRLIKRVHRMQLPGGTGCQEALSIVSGQFRTMGTTFDPETMRLAGSMELRVGLSAVPSSSNECQPTSQPDFLGNENQLVRVQADGAGGFLWGYDNGSTLYRVSSPTPATLVLTGVPVDAHHQPRRNQIIEVLGVSVTLDDEAQIAELTGMPVKVEAYDPTTRTVTLEAGTVIPRGRTILFARLWENRIEIAGDGETPAELVDANGTSTGLHVCRRGTPIGGDYWMIGVRPGIGQPIFPKRLRSFQRADGPGRWLAPLAVIAWHDSRTGDVIDCRRPFRNLVDLSAREGGCCELLVRPGDDVQRLVDDAIARADRGNGFGLHLKFAAGEFRFERTLVVNGGRNTRNASAQITVSGCGQATTLRSLSQEVVLCIGHWTRAGVFDLTVEAGTAGPGRGKKQRADVYPPAQGDELRHLGGAVTLINCESAIVERLSAACGDADRRSASCVAVRNTVERVAKDIRVHGCDLRVGSRQAGVLVVNAERATVEDCRVQLRPGAGTVVGADERARLKRQLIDQIRIGDASTRPAVSDREEVQFALGKVPLRFKTPKVLIAAWTRALSLIDVVRTEGAMESQTPSKTERLAVQRHIDGILQQALQPGTRGPLGEEDLKPFVEYIAWLQRRLPIVAGQGIVIAGTVASDVRVINNSLSDVMDGVHIGLAARDPKQGSIDPKDRASTRIAGRIQIVGNTVGQHIPMHDYGARSAIFVGNAMSSTIRDNSVAGNHETWTRRGDGIRVWGVVGPLLLVAGNQVRDAQVGIHVHVIKTPFVEKLRPKHLWLLSQNLVVDCDPDPLIIASEVSIAADNVY